LSPDLRARATDRLPIEAGTIGLRWLGTAGFELRTSRGSLLFDPFLTRPTASEVAFARMAPNDALLTEVLPDATLILIGHSHYDHLMDAPSIARRTSATIAGTRTTCLAARAMRAEKCVTLRPGEILREGPFEVFAIRSRHAEAPLIGVPNPGVIERPPRWRWPHAIDLPMGGALIWVVRVEGLTIVHLSSAGLPNDPTLLRRMIPGGADIVLASIAIREGTPGYARSLLSELRPRLLVPHHHDPLFGPLDDPLPERSRLEVARFREEASDANIRELAPLEELRVTAAEIRALPAQPAREAERQ
jgi:L-ascorbate metabolism protein UlaG (beta-lactamase superfamily)